MTRLRVSKVRYIHNCNIISHGKQLTTISNCGRLFRSFAAHQCNVVDDDESPQPKGILYEPTSGVLQILLSAELKQLDNL